MSRERIIQIAVIVASVTLFICLLFYTLDYVLWRDGRIKNRLAKLYCECTLNEAVQNGDYELMEEGFMYAKGLETCWADEFKKYRKGLTDFEKETFISDLRDIIFERCPGSNEQVMKGIDIPE